MTLARWCSSWGWVTLSVTTTVLVEYWFFRAMAQHLALRFHLPLSPMTPHLPVDSSPNSWSLCPHLSPSAARSVAGRALGPGPARYNRDMNPTGHALLPLRLLPFQVPSTPHWQGRGLGPTGPCPIGPTRSVPWRLTTITGSGCRFSAWRSWVAQFRLGSTRSCRADWPRTGWPRTGWESLANYHDKPEGNFNKWNRVHSLLVG